MEKPLGKQVRDYEETFSAADAVKEEFLPCQRPHLDWFPVAFGAAIGFLIAILGLIWLGQ